MSKKDRDKETTNKLAADIMADTKKKEKDTSLQFGGGGKAAGPGGTRKSVNLNALPVGDNAVPMFDGTENF